MAILEIYSKRRRREQSEGPADVYRYDLIPKKLRVQIVHLWRDAFGVYSELDPTWAYRCFKAINNVLCREYGVFSLPGTRLVDTHYNEACAEFLLDGASTDEALDIIELSFRLIWREPSEDGRYPEISQEEADTLIAELNARFNEHAVGYQFESGNVVRIDSALVHVEMVRPALHLLAEQGFEGADEEFRSGYEHYRHGNHKEALVDALKAFESTMKTICKRKGWAVADNATAKPLLAVLFEHELLPAALQSHFSSLRSTLEAGVPTLRNKMGGHGQGEAPTELPSFLAAYALHLTAANIVMLVEAMKAKA